MTTLKKIDKDIFKLMAADPEAVEGPDDMPINGEEIKKEYESEEGHKSKLEHVDEAKWNKAKEISKKTYGEVRWPFVSFLYYHKL